MMKNSKDSTPFLVILVAFVCFSFLLFDQEDVVVIFDVQSAAVDKNKPILVLAAMNKGEFLKINYGLASGSSGLVSDVSVRVTDMKGGEIRSIKTGASIRADNTANFKIEFSAPKYMKLDIKASKTGDDDTEVAGKRDLLKLSKCFIDEKKSGKPNFQQTVRLKAGDQLAIGSSDPKAAVLTCYMRRTGETYSVKDKPVIDIPDDGNYTLEFYVDRGSVGWLKQAKEGIGLDGKDFYFSDLTVSRIRPTAPGKAVPAAPGEKAVAKKEEFNPALLIESSSKQLKEVMEKNQLDQDAQAKLMADLIGGLMRKDTLMKSVLGVPNPINEDVPAKLNYVKTNKIARELEIDESAHYWVFWIGTGDGAEAAYKDKNLRTITDRSKSIFQIFADIILKGKSPNTSLFPLVQEYPEGLSEDIEFAVVDEANKERFMRGEPYSPYAQMTSKVNVTSFFGFAKVPDMKQTLYLCLSNNNRISPVHVNFQFVTFVIEPEYQ